MSAITPKINKSESFDKNLLFNPEENTPDDILASILPFLSDEELFASAQVSRGWHLCEIAEAERMDRLETKYPQEIVQAFRTTGMRIYHLPRLKLGNIVGEADLIDSINLEQMTSSVMRFTDRTGRPGLALRIRANRWTVFRNSLEELREYYPRITNNVRQGEFDTLGMCLRRILPIVKRFLMEPGHDVVLASFKRRRTPEDRTWSFAWGDSDDFIERAMRKRHRENGYACGILEPCRDCPFVNNHINPTVFSSLLSGTDPDFSIPGSTPATSQRSIVVTALVALAIAYFVNACFVAENSSI